MRFIAKLIIIFLSIYATSVVIAFLFGFSITFPFTLNQDTYVPEHRLHAIRLATFTTFVYFSIRYMFWGSTRIYPIQFMGIFLFNLSVVGTLCFLVMDVENSEYFQSIFFFISSVILYYAGKPEIRNYFRRK